MEDRVVDDISKIRIFHYLAKLFFPGDDNCGHPLTVIYARHGLAERLRDKASR